MTTLAHRLNGLFRPAPIRKPDPYRNDRIESKRLAKERGVEIEKFKEGGFNVWPPKNLPDEKDPFHGDHYCADWAEVYVMVRTYWGRTA